MRKIAFYSWVLSILPSVDIMEPWKLERHMLAYEFCYEWWVGVSWVLPQIQYLSKWLCSCSCIVNFDAQCCKSVHSVTILYSRQCDKHVCFIAKKNCQRCRIEWEYGNYVLWQNTISLAFAESSYLKVS